MATSKKKEASVKEVQEAVVSVEDRSNARRK